MVFLINFLTKVAPKWAYLGAFWARNMGNFWQNWAISYAVALLKMDQFCLMLYDDCFAHSIVVKNKLLFRKREGRYLNEQKGAWNVSILLNALRRVFDVHYLNYKWSTWTAWSLCEWGRCGVGGAPPRWTSSGRSCTYEGRFRCRTSLSLSVLTVFVSVSALTLTLTSTSTLKLTLASSSLTPFDRFSFSSCCVSGICKWRHKNKSRWLVGHDT